jgi:hypothetical protein
MRLAYAAVAAVTLLGGTACNSTSKTTGSEGPGGEGGAATAPTLPSLGTFLTAFEGEIDLDAKQTKRDSAGSPPEDMPLALFVKSGKLRVDLPEKLTQGGPAASLGAKAYAIFDSAAKKAYIVSDARKEVIVIDLEKSGEQFKGMARPTTPHGPGGAPANETPPKVTKTGKYDTVAGYKCENWDIASDHREGRACVAQEGVSWLSLPLTGIPTEHAWMLELLDGKHFPLRFVGYSKDGATEEGRIEVTKIDKKTLQASEFEYPPTYKIVDLATMFAMMGRFGAGMPGMPPGMPPGMAGMPGMPEGMAGMHHGGAMPPGQPHHP